MKTATILMGMVFLQGALAENTPLRILPVGDSITHGWYSGIGSNPLNSYRKELKSLLTGNGHEVDFVGNLTNGDFPDNQHEGHDGWHASLNATTNDILGQISGWMAATDAAIVLLHIGTNDLNGNDTGTVAEVSAILDEIQTANSNATVVLARIIGVKNDPSLQTAISSFNSNLNTMAQARIAAGEDIIVIDMENGAGIDYESSDMKDRLHPSQIGYDKMATHWYPAVIQAIARQTPPPRFSSVTVSGNSIALSIDNLVAGRQTVIEQSGSLTTPVWSNAAAFVPSTTHTNWPLPIGSTGAYYRIVIP